MFKPNILIALFFWLLSTSAAHAESLPSDLIWITNNDAPIWADLNAEKGGVFNDYILAFPPSLRTVGPDSNSSFRSYILNNEMGLTNSHPDTSEVIPQLATSWAYGKDNKTVYYKLDPRARWSDGVPVTVNDFIFTLEFMRSKNIQAPWYNKHYTEQILSVKKYSDHIMSITGATARPKEELHYYHEIPATPRHFYKEIGSDWVKKYNWVIPPNTCLLYTSPSPRDS